MKLDPHHWSRAWFRLGSNCDSMDNNICEPFNKWIVEPRCHPVISCFEAIRKKVYARIEKQRTDSEKWTGIICPTVMRKLEKSINMSAYCHVAWNGDDSYEVTQREHRFKVNLVDWTCACRYWQLSGLPCPRGISCIYYKTNNIEEYIHKCYSIEEFKKTYGYCPQPVEGRPAWPVSDRLRPEPPGEIAMSERKKKSRTREDQEKPRVATRVSRVGTKIKCSVCKQFGHNKTSCKPRHGIGSSITAASAMEGQGPARSKGKSPEEGQGLARSKATSARSKAPSASQAPDMAPKQSSAAQSKRKATSDLKAPKAKRRPPISTSNTTHGNTINVHGVVVGSQSSSNVNVSSGSVVARGSNAFGTRGKGKNKYARFHSLLGFEDDV